MAIQYDESKTLKPANLIEPLLDVMQNHIGYKNAVTGEILFEEIFMKEPEKNYSDYYRWECLKTAMRKLRHKSNCFIAQTRDAKTNQFNYFILSNMKEVRDYNGKIDNFITSLENLQDRAKKSVKEKWYKQTWTVDVKLPKDNDLLEEH